MDNNYNSSSAFTADSPYLRPRLHPDGPSARKILAGCPVYQIPETTLLLGFTKLPASENESPRPVTNDDLIHWNASISDVLHAALHYGAPEATIRPISQAVGEPENADPLPIQVVSNKSGHFGAAAVLYRQVQAELNTIFPEGWWIIPSSVHEMLVLSCRMIPAIDLIQMNRDININELTPDEVLSTGLYEPDEKSLLRPVPIEAGTGETKHKTVYLNYMTV